jgi:hypothetical protein
MKGRSHLINSSSLYVYPPPHVRPGMESFLLSQPLPHLEPYVSSLLMTWTCMRNLPKEPLCCLEDHPCGAQLSR